MAHQEALLAIMGEGLRSMEKRKGYILLITMTSNRSSKALVVRENKMAPVGEQLTIAASSYLFCHYEALQLYS